MIRDIDRQFYTLNPAELLALLAWGEARGEGSEGMDAVMLVCRNRSLKKGWFMDSGLQSAGLSDLHCVILKNTFVASKSAFIYQFSCFQDKDPNRVKLIDIANSPAIKKFVDVDRAWSVIYGDVEDITKGATYYINQSICNPGWAKNMIQCVTIGNHQFMRES